MSDYARTMIESVTDPTRDPPQAASAEPDLVIFDGLEDALIGEATRFTAHGHKRFMVYDYSKCVEIIAEQMSEDPDAGDHGERVDLAIEHLSYNVLGCYAGDTTPAFVMPADE